MKEKLALPTDEARATIGVGRTEFYKLLASGKLRSVRVGRKIIVPISEIQRFLSENTAGEDIEKG